MNSSPPARRPRARPVAQGRVRLVALMVALAACSAQSGVTTGVVTAVDGDLTTVRSFTVFDDGELLTFVPVDDGDYAFPLTHLTEHLREGDPIRVDWGMIDGDRVALAIADA